MKLTKIDATIFVLSLLSTFTITACKKINFNNSNAPVKKHYVIVSSVIANNSTNLEQANANNTDTNLVAKTKVKKSSKMHAIDLNKITNKLVYEANKQNKTIQYTNSNLTIMAIPEGENDKCCNVIKVKYYKNRKLFRTVIDHVCH